MSLENKEQLGIFISEAMANEQGLRERVRSMVLRALADREWDRAEMRDVMRQSFAGVGDGMTQRGSQAADAAKEAVQGLDEAVGRSVYALKMALEETWGQGRQFAQTDLKDTVEAIKDLEDDLLGTLKDSADKSQGWIKDTFAGLYDHLARNGSDTGLQVKDTLESLGNRLGTAASGAGSELKEQAKESKERLRAVASGILRGLADTLDSRGK
jgi:gas vesicle protein